MMRKMIVAAMLGSLVLAAGACNTVKGAGKDIESVGNAADKAMR